MPLKVVVWEVIPGSTEGQWVSNPQKGRKTIKSLIIVIKYWELWGQHRTYLTVVPPKGSKSWDSNPSTPSLIG